MVGVVEADGNYAKYAARWTGYFWAGLADLGVYNFRVRANDGVRLYVQGDLVIHEWRDQAPTNYDVDVSITTEGFHEVVMEFYEGEGSSVAELFWTPPGQPEEHEIGSSRLFPVYTQAGCSVSCTTLQGFRSEWFNYDPTNMSHVPDTPAYTLVQESVLHSAQPPSGHDGQMVGVVEADQDFSNYAARWTGYFWAGPADLGVYNFRVRADDGVRLYVQGNLVIHEWRDQAAEDHVTGVSITTEGFHEVVMEFFEGTGSSVAELFWTPPGEPVEHEMGFWATDFQFPVYTQAGCAVPCSTSQGFRSEWFNYDLAEGQNIDDTPAYTIVQESVFHSAQPPAGPDGQMVGVVEADGNYAKYAARWTGYFWAGLADLGVYNFRVRANDGVRLYVQGDLVIHEWRDQAPTNYDVDVSITTEGFHEVVMEFYEGEGSSVAELFWTPPNGTEHTMGTNDQFRVYTGECDVGNANELSSVGGANETVMHALSNEELRVKVSACAALGWDAERWECAGMPAWDTSAVSDMSYLFEGERAFDMDIAAWDTSNVSDMSGMFARCSSFNGDISRWDTGRVRSFKHAFQEAKAFDGDLGSWDVSSAASFEGMFERAEAFRGRGLGSWATSGVQTMTAMFHKAYAFNEAIGAWDTSAVTDMRWMFFQATAFNQPIGAWNVSGVTSFKQTFAGAAVFNHPLGSWDTSSVAEFAHMFQDAKAFDGDLGGWDVSAGTTLEGMFERTDAFHGRGLSEWDTSSVTSLVAMCHEALVFNGDISRWDTSKVTDMRWLFTRSPVFNQNIGGWDVSKVWGMTEVFNRARAFDQPIGQWDTRSVTDMEYMFYECASFNHPIGDWDTSQVSSFLGTFTGAISFNQDLSGWDTSRVTTMNSMFYGALAMSGDLSGWDTSAVRDMSWMFHSASQMNGDVSTWNVRAVTAMTGMFYRCTSFRQDLSGWRLDSLQNAQWMMMEASAFEGGDLSAWGMGACDAMDSLFHGAEAFNGDVSKWQTGSLLAMPDMFSGARSFAGDLSLWDVSRVQSFVGVFRHASSFNADLSKWDTAAATLMEEMFFGASSFNSDISKWAIAETNVFSKLFKDARAFNQDLSQWDTSAATSMDDMFSGCEAFTSDLSRWDTSRVTTAAGMFRNAAAFDADLSGWDTSNVRSMSGMFAGAASANPDVSRWDTSAVVEMAEMFAGASAFNRPLAAWDVSRVRNMSRLFADAAEFDQDLSAWRTVRVADMREMFAGAAAFDAEIGVWRTAAVTDMRGMFRGASAFNAALGSWNTSAVADMSEMFRGASSFNGDLSAWDTASVTDMSGMFSGAEAFAGDLSQWATGAVTSMESMFSHARAFNAAISQWDTSSVTTMTEMFFGAELFSQPLTGWDTSRVTEMRWMFGDAAAFDGDVAGFDTSQVTSMSGMFAGAARFNQDLSGWDVSRVRTMEEMFAGAARFNGAIGGWDTRSVATMQMMFTEAAAFNQNLSAWDRASIVNDDAGSLFLGSPKLSFADVDECLAGSYRDSPGCRCAGDQELRCANTDGSFQCSCLDLPLTSCPADLTTLQFRASDLVACVALGAACSFLPEYQCSRAAAPGSECSEEFAGVARLCEERDTVVVPATLAHFRDAAEFALEEEEVAQMVSALGLDGGKLRAAPRLRVELEPATEDTRWLCGGEPDEAYFDLGDSGLGKSLPYVYLALSTALTIANDAVIHLREAIERREWFKIAVMLVGAGLEVVGGTFLVSGVDTVAMSNGQRLSGRCELAGTYAGMDFRLGQRCGGLESAHRFGVEVQPMCREASILTSTGLYVGLVDILYGLIVLLVYGPSAFRTMKQGLAANRSDGDGDAAEEEGGSKDVAVLEQDIRSLQDRVKQQADAMSKVQAENALLLRQAKARAQGTRSGGASPAEGAVTPAECAANPAAGSSTEEPLAWPATASLDHDTSQQRREDGSKQARGPAPLAAPASQCGSADDGSSGSEPSGTVQGGQPASPSSGAAASAGAGAAASAMLCHVSVEPASGRAVHSRSAASPPADAVAAPELPPLLAPAWGDRAAS